MRNTVDHYNFSPYSSQNHETKNSNNDIHMEKNLIVSNGDLATIKLLNPEPKKAYDIILNRLHKKKKNLKHSSWTAQEAPEKYFFIKLY